MTDQARMLQWIVTGENKFEADYVRHNPADSATISIGVGQGLFIASASANSAIRQGPEPSSLGSSESETPLGIVNLSYKL